jgi:hypothetical protein
MKCRFPIVVGVVRRGRPRACPVVAVVASSPLSLDGRGQGEGAPVSVVSPGPLFLSLLLFAFQFFIFNL